MRNVMILSLFLLSAVVSEAKGVNCEAREWPFARDVSVKLVAKTLRQLNRNYILQMAWGESTRSPEDSMAIVLWQYLASTEQNPSFRGYYKAIQKGFLDETPAQDAIKQWPRRPEASYKNLQLKDLCRLYELSDEKKK